MTPAQTRNRLKYYSYLAESSQEQYDKPWLSTVSEAECAGAETLADVVMDGETWMVRRVGSVPVSFVSAMGHKFGPDATCNHCELSWEDHQRTRSKCDKYVEPANAPKEDPKAIRKRETGLDALYEKPKRKSRYQRQRDSYRASKERWEAEALERDRLFMTVTCVGCSKNCSWSTPRSQPVRCFAGRVPLMLSSRGEGIWDRPEGLV